MDKGKPVEKGLMQEFLERQEKLFKRMYGREMTSEEKEHYEGVVENRIREWAMIIERAERKENDYGKTVEEN